MKIVSKLWIAVSLMLLLIVASKLLDAYVSLKYEVEEVHVSSQLNEAVIDKKKLLDQMIVGLWSAATYLLVNIIIMVRRVYNNQ
ncbi:hypothetical protein [Dyadobacter jiangsuensis]|nr:hypothetical protein [Dyadobacter jiangsuensis]